MLNGRGVVFFRSLGLKFVAGLDGPIHDSGFVYMQADFFPCHILHHVKFSIDLQQVSIDRLSAWGCHVASPVGVGCHSDTDDHCEREQPDEHFHDGGFLYVIVLHARGLSFFMTSRQYIVSFVASG